MITNYINPWFTLFWKPVRTFEKIISERPYRFSFFVLTVISLLMGSYQFLKGLIRYHILYYKDFDMSFFDIFKISYVDSITSISVLVFMVMFYVSGVRISSYFVGIKVPVKKLQTAACLSIIPIIVASILMFTDMFVLYFPLILRVSYDFSPTVYGTITNTIGKGLIFFSFLLNAILVNKIQKRCNKKTLWLPILALIVAIISYSAFYSVEKLIMQIINNKRLASLLAL